MLGAPTGGGAPPIWLGICTVHWPECSFCALKAPMLVHEWKVGSVVAKRLPCPTKLKWSPLRHTWPGKAMGAPVKLTGLFSARVHVMRYGSLRLARRATPRMALSAGSGILPSCAS